MHTYRLGQKYAKQRVYSCIVINYCILFHVSNCKPTFASPCIYLLNQKFQSVDLDWIKGFKRGHCDFISRVWHK